MRRSLDVVIEKYSTMSLMTMPAMLLNFFKPEIVNDLQKATGFWKVLLFTSQPSLLINSSADSLN